MKLHDVSPCALLSPFVECYWYVEASREESSPVPDAALPNGTSNLIFNLSGFPHREYHDESCADSLSLRTRWFAGIRDHALIVGPTDCTRVVGVRFRPGGLIPFVDVPPAETARLTIDADELGGTGCHHLHEQLLEAHGIHALFELLEDWLLARFDPHAAHGGLLNSLRLLNSTAGNVEIPRLALAADLSPRQFRRRFEQAVGVTPKKLARILRFRKLIRRLASLAAVDWAGAAFECGYFDQSHLIADFREFAGVSPGEYVRRNPSIPGFMPLNVPMSVFSNTPDGGSARIVTR